ncbi:MAG: hypothetical protein VB144_15350 [Clostridia bacterium]|nr:hypothetical protein [Clostridia bacterium]
MPLAAERLRKFAACVLIVLTAIAFSVAASAKAVTAPRGSVQLEPGSELEWSGSADVTGDGIDDDIRLVGRPIEAGALFCSSHDIVVVDGASGRTISFPLGELSAGYKGDVTLGRIVFGHALDIVVSIPTGGSGGITNCFVVSVDDGKAKFLVDPSVLAQGPELDITATDGYTLRIEDPARKGAFSIDLRQATSEDASLSETYKGVYSESGKLLKPLDSVVDPCGAIELAPNDDGVSQVIVHQKIWAVYHANGVALVRSTWHWNNGNLRIASVSVMPPINPDNYEKYLTTLDPAKPGPSVEAASKAYKEQFQYAPPALREVAFLQLRDFHNKVAAEQSNYLVHQAEGEDGFKRVSDLASSLKASDEYHLAGLTPVYEGEGMWTVVARPGFYIEEFGSLLSDEYRDFLALEDMEANWPWALDAALMIPLDSLGARVRAWEAYIEDHPTSPFTSEAQTHYRNELSALILGLNNTPNFDYETGRIRPGVEDALRRYVRLNSDAPSAQAVTKAMGIYRKNRCIADDSVRSEIMRLAQ